MDERDNDIKELKIARDITRNKFKGFQENLGKKKQEPFALRKE